MRRTGRGKLDVAEAHLRRSVAILERAGQDDELSTSLGSLAEVVIAKDGFAAGRPLYERALEVHAKARGKDTSYVMTAMRFAHQLANEGDCAAARPYLDQCVVHFDKIGHAASAGCRVVLAQCEQEGGRADAAIALLEKAVETCRATGCPGMFPGMLARLADLVVAKDRTRGVALMKEARAQFEALGNAGAVAMADDWLKSHR
jgi:hypothetical protein